MASFLAVGAFQHKQEMYPFISGVTETVGALRDLSTGGPHAKSICNYRLKKACPVKNLRLMTWNVCRLSKPQQHGKEESMWASE